MNSTDAIDQALQRFHPLDEDQPFMAFGADDRYFFGGPTRYCGSHLPVQIVGRLEHGNIRRIPFASFGHDSRHWFVTF